MENNANEYFLPDLWGTIDAPNYPEGRTVHPEDLRFWVSIDDDWYPLFFVQTGIQSEITPLDNIGDIEVRVEKFQEGLRYVCCLRSSDVDLKDKFNTVTKDVVLSCIECDDEQLLGKVQSEIRSWAEFMTPTRSGLGESALIGILGELYLIKEMLPSKLSARDLMRGWIGPDAKKQDFVFEDYAIEVKVNKAGGTKTISISSLDQLDAEANEIFIARIVLAPCSDDLGVSLQDLYEDCLCRFEGDHYATRMFKKKVSNFLGKATTHELSQRFEIVHTEVFEVTKEFPVLTRKNTPNGIVRAQYSLELAALEEFRKDASVLKELGHE